MEKVGPEDMITGVVGGSLGSVCAAFFSLYVSLFLFLLLSLSISKIESRSCFFIPRCSGARVY